MLDSDSITSLHLPQCPRAERLQPDGSILPYPDELDLGRSRPGDRHISELIAELRAADLESWQRGLEGGARYRRHKRLRGMLSEREPAGRPVILKPATVQNINYRCPVPCKPRVQEKRTATPEPVRLPYSVRPDYA